GKFVREDPASGASGSNSVTTVNASVSFGHPEILPATKQEMPIVANLFELYAHDFSAFHFVEPRPDGRFNYPDLPLYWSEPGRYPFLIKVDGKLAGFALIRQLPPVAGHDAVWDVAEFFVLRAYRRRGVGREAACGLWRQFPGRWQVRVMRTNQTAHGFWQRAIAAFAGDAVGSPRAEKASEMWDVFSFSSITQR
ncbi:MAG: GNAT family N-acetyltransferase, partial [Limisphaerales bacterium]